MRPRHAAARWSLAVAAAPTILLTGCQQEDPDELLEPAEFQTNQEPGEAHDEGEEDPPPPPEDADEPGELEE